MKRLAKTLSWIALIFGLPPMLVCVTWLFAGGLQFIMYLALAVLPPIPLILTQESTDWATPPPIVPLVLAIVSLLISVLIYSNYFRLSITFD
ncbi:MAG: hypothetical protein ACJ8H8_21735 [Geminicoccaceae bacterium]|jgi:hypothetical protein